jgi:hypothetical protein
MTDGNARADGPGAAALAALKSIVAIGGGKQYLQCFGCLKLGGYDTFGLPTRCPDCGSGEIHHPDAGSNWPSSKKGNTP